MSSNTRSRLITGLTIILLLLVSITSSYAQTVTYTYDELNRLKQVQNGDGTIIQYIYDSTGNRIQVQSSDVTSPVTTASPAGGTHNTPQSVTLTCIDGMGGSGCDRIYYTTDGTTPTTSSSVYSSAMSISSTTTLMFFAKDLAGNSESIKTQTYTISTGNPTITIQFKDSNGNPLSGGIVQYYSSGWQTFGTTDATGQAIKQLAAGTYTFAMIYAYGRQEKSQNVSTNPTVGFQTTRVAAQLQDSTGNLIDTGTVQYYAGAWRDMGSTSGGQAFKELLPSTYTFAMTYAYGKQEKSQNISTNPTIIFQTTRVTVRLQDSIGTLIDTGTVQYYGGAWRNLGSTSGGQAFKELLPGTYTFAMAYAYGRQEKSQNVSTNPIVVFQTIRISVQLPDSTGTFIDTGTVQYYAGAWRNMGVTSGGQAFKELLPGTYTFSMTYAYGRQEKSQNVSTNPTVVFQTTRVVVRLQDSTGTLMDTGTVQYYAGAWRNLGSTSGGQAFKELLPGTYTFAMTYANGRQEKSQNVSTNPTVVFATGRVHSNTGSCTYYYAGAWRVFTQDMELIPATYTFRFNDGTSNSSYVIIGSSANNIH
jgi:YD repeat-containing protein